MQPGRTNAGIAELAARILKVDHAGEHGAVNIYTGQLIGARFTARGMLTELREFRQHEQGHRARFWAELQRRGQRRCRSYWLCGLGGFALGLVTGLCGRHAIAATTVAVERVVLRHLQEQLAVLEGRDTEAAAAIQSIVAEERQHHDQSAKHAQGDRLWSRVLSPVVSASTEAVIWMGVRA